MSDARMSGDDSLTGQEVTGQEVGRDAMNMSAIQGEIAEMEKREHLRNRARHNISMRVLQMAIAEQKKTYVPDMRSVYITNLDYETTEDDLWQHFQSCGSITRITILHDKVTGNPKGCAYVEFQYLPEMCDALAKTGSLLRGRNITVNQKIKKKAAGATESQSSSPVVVNNVYRGGAGTNPRGGGRSGFVPY